MQLTDPYLRTSLLFRVVFNYVDGLIEGNKENCEKGSIINCYKFLLVDIFMKINGTPDNMASTVKTGMLSKVPKTHFRIYPSDIER